MKDRIKKFYRDHKDEVAIYCAGVATGVITVSIIAVKAIDGRTITAGNMYAMKDGTKLYEITHKDGKYSVLQSVTDDT